MRVDLDSWNGRTLSGGRYKVATKLGEGGMGVVYRAWDNHLETDVVIKFPQPVLQATTDFSARFLREVRSLVRLAHPHVVRVLDVDEEGGVCFAVMQFLAGGSLYDRPTRASDGGALPMTLASLCDWLEAVADALDFIHAEGFIHRDVKPENILFDAHGNAYLSDFGMAKALAAILPENYGAKLTGAGMMIGTPGYVAPEQIMGQHVDGRSDQYGLASTVYEMLVGRNPFSGVPLSAILVHQTTKGARPPNEVCASIPAPVSLAIHRAMSIEPPDRFSSCAEFARAVLQASESKNFDEWIAGSEVVAPPRPRPASPSPLRTVVAAPPDVSPPPSPGRTRTPTMVIPGLSGAPPPVGSVLSQFAEPPSRLSPPPANTDFVDAACPNCRKPLRLPRNALGQKVQCPKCGVFSDMSAKLPSLNQPTKAQSGPAGSGARVPPPLPSARAGGSSQVARVRTPPIPARPQSKAWRGKNWYLAAAGLFVGIAIALVLLGTNVLDSITGSRSSHSNASETKTDKSGTHR
jgi:serine/threonine protein kinase